MKYILIILVFLAAFFPIYINVSAFASKTQVNGLEHLQAYNISFLIKADLNNDGKDKKVTLFRQWDGEGWWSDDLWYVLYIFDDNHNIIHTEEISYFQEVDSLSVKDTDGDGLKEIIVSSDPAKYWSPRTYTYGWIGDRYEVISD